MQIALAIIGAGAVVVFIVGIVVHQIILNERLAALESIVYQATQGRKP